MPPKEALYLQEPRRVPHRTLRSRSNLALSPHRDRDPERQGLTVWWHCGACGGMEASSRSWWTAFKSCQLLSLLPVSAPLFCDISMICPGLHFGRAGWGVWRPSLCSMCLWAPGRQPSLSYVDIVLRVSVIPALDLKEGSAIGLWPGSPGI